MPTLPTYESKRNVQQTGMRTPNATPVRAVNEVAPIKGMVEAAETLKPALKAGEEVIGAWQKAQDTMDYTKAKAKYETGIATIKTAAANDPNPDNFPAYQNQLLALKKDFEAGFHNKQLAQMSAIELDHEINIASMQVGSEFKKKQLFANRLNIESTIDSLVKTKIATPHANLKKKIDQKIGQLVNANYANGTISEAEAVNYIKAARVIEQRYLISADNATTEKESEVLKALNKNKDLPAEEKLSLISESQKRIFNNNQSFKKQVDNNEDAITARLADKNQQQPTEQEIVNLMNTDQITPKFARATIENLKSTKEKKENRSAEFSKIVDFMVTPGNKAEDIRVEMLRQEAMGNIDKDEFKILYTFNQNANNKAIDNASPQKNLIQTLTFWSDENAGMKTTESKSRMFKDYMIQVNEGVDPEVAVKAAIKREIIKLHPQAAGYPEEGQLVYDIMGNIKLIKNGEIVNPKQKSK